MIACCAPGGHDKIDLPEPLTVRVVGRNFYWNFTYPGADGKLGTDDDVDGGTDLHVPEGHPVRLELTSDDYIYVFRANALDLKETAVPDIFFTIDFTPSSIGRFDLEVDPMCRVRILHEEEDNMGQLVVESRAQFLKWLRNRGPVHNGSQ
jgi:cytochrome c oxidase subunit 2